MTDPATPSPSRLRDTQVCPYYDALAQARKMPPGAAGGPRPSAQTSLPAQLGLNMEHPANRHGAAFDLGPGLGLPPAITPRPAHLPAGTPSSLFTRVRETHSPRRTRFNRAGHFHSPQPKRNLQNAAGYKIHRQDESSCPTKAPVETLLLCTWLGGGRGQNLLGPRDPPARHTPEP